MSTPTTTFVRFDGPPPPPQRRRSRPGPAHVTADILRAQPGEWAHIQTRASRQQAAQAAYMINRGAPAAFRPGGAFEAVSRTVDDEYLVYARYIGPGAAASPAESSGGTA